MGEEIEELWHRYRFDDLSFQDETYFTYAPRVEAVAEEFLRRELPITWAATMRADQGDRLPEEALAICKRSGLRRVMIGVESGSQEMMDRIKKDIKLEQVFEERREVPPPRHHVIFPFIVGFPGESDESVQASLDVAKRLRALSPGFETPIFYFKPYPGSPLTDDAVARRLRPPRDSRRVGPLRLHRLRRPLGHPRDATAWSSASSSTSASPGRRRGGAGAGAEGCRGETVAIVFGRERIGLENHEVAMADGIVTLPVNPAFASLNLAQAVIVVAYEWFKLATGGALPFSSHKNRRWQRRNSSRRFSTFSRTNSSASSFSAPPRSAAR